MLGDVTSISDECDYLLIKEMGTLISWITKLSNKIIRVSRKKVTSLLKHFQTLIRIEILNIYKLEI